jgi:hypothetical protein
MEPKGNSRLFFSDFGDTLNSSIVQRFGLFWDVQCCPELLCQNTSKTTYVKPDFHRQCSKSDPSGVPNGIPFPFRFLFFDVFSPSGAKVAQRMLQGSPSDSKRDQKGTNMEPKRGSGTVAGLPQASGFNMVTHGELF